MKRTGAGATRRRGTASGTAGQGAARPLATSSALPLFPSDAGRRGHDAPRPRAPLGVRRPTPAVARLRSPVSGRPSEPRLSFENLPVPAHPDRGSRIAGPTARVAAGLFDVALLVTLDVVVIGLTLRVVELDLQSLGMLPVAPLAGFLILINGGYVVILTGTGGQTFGKMAFGVRVVDRSGGVVTMSVALVRALGYLVSVLPLGAGGVLMFFDPERRTLHDRLAGTRVVKHSSAPGRKA